MLRLSLLEHIDQPSIEDTVGSWVVKLANHSVSCCGYDIEASLTPQDQAQDRGIVRSTLGSLKAGIADREEAAR